MTDLYTILKDCENSKELNDSYEKDAMQKLDELKEYLPYLNETIQKVGTKLREIQKDKKAGSLLQSHRIEDYWEQTQIKEFSKLVDIVGIDLSKSDFTNQEFIDSIRSSAILKGKKNIYALPNLRKGLKIGPLATAGVTLASAAGMVGLGYLFGGDVKSVKFGAVLLGTIFGSWAAFMSSLYTFRVFKNPFERVASNLEERTEYVLEQANNKNMNQK